MKDNAITECLVYDSANGMLYDIWSKQLLDILKHQSTK